MPVGVCGIGGRKYMRGKVSFVDEEEREKKKIRSEEGVKSVSFFILHNFA